MEILLGLATLLFFIAWIDRLFTGNYGMLWLVTQFLVFACTSVVAIISGVVLTLCFIIPTPMEKLLIVAAILFCSVSLLVAGGTHEQECNKRNTA